MESDAVKIYKKVLNGDLKRFPNQFWKDINGVDNAKDIVKYLFENVLKWTDKEIRENLKADIFREYKLGGMLWNLFKGSPFEVINNAYPNKFKEWDFRNAAKHTWENKENRNKAIRELLIKVKKDKFEELTNVDFLNNGLGGLMDYLIRNKEFINIKPTEVEDRILFNERILKVTFNKSGGTSSRNGVTTRITLPTSWIKELGITENNREVIVKLNENKEIIIRKKGE